jgi:hypothetical protein
MRGKPFQDGNTFGKGRPQGSGYSQFCQEWAERFGWDLLRQWAEGRENGKKVPFMIRRYAVNTLLEYGYGKPKEALEISGSGPQTIRDWIVENIPKAPPTNEHTNGSAPKHL